jgi:queuosine precursor transporter
MRRFRYLDLLSIGFAVVLLISNLLGPKICRSVPLRPSAAGFLFPLTCICGDAFTEVYGYGASRRAIWLGFFALALLIFMGQLSIYPPPAPEWHGQDAFATVFRVISRFAVASLAAFWAREFTNSFTLAKLKLFTGGRWLWTRTVGSTLTGKAVDTAGLIMVAFGGGAAARHDPSDNSLRLFHQGFGGGRRDPITYLVVGWLKSFEAVDAFDRRTNFNPFAWLAQTA